MSTEPERGPKREDGYERRDANMRALFGFGLGLAIVIIVVVLGMRWMFGFVSKEEPLGPPPTPFENARVLPPQPRLQVQPHMDLKTYCDQQLNDLNSYGWVDQPNGIVHIPIDEAMDDVLKQGLPTRPAGQPEEVEKVPSVGTVQAPKPMGLGGPCGFVAERSPVGPGK
jgi:hypothetical protein